MFEMSNVNEVMLIGDVFYLNVRAEVRISSFCHSLDDKRKYKKTTQKTSINEEDIDKLKVRKVI